jgi:hypothetical protein
MACSCCLYFKTTPESLPSKSFKNAETAAPCSIILPIVALPGENKMHLSPELAALFAVFHQPCDIQIYLDSIPYVGEELNRSPLRLARDRQAHCLDGGLLAAAALAYLGFPPRILDLVPEPGTDDDHVLAVFGQPGAWGALAKSNYAGLRYREPVFRSLRELVMSYFDDFFNIDRQRTLRGYTRLLDLRPFDRYAWLTSEVGVERVVRRLYSLKVIPLLTPERIAALTPVDERSFQAGTLGLDIAEVFKVNS